MFENTIQLLKANGLVGENDAVFAATQQADQGSVNMAYFFCGAIGSAIAASKTKNVIISVNPEEIKVFEIDNKTAAYLDIVSRFSAGQLKKVKTRGRKQLILKLLPSGVLSFRTKYSFLGFEQQPEVDKAFELLEQYYLQK